LSINLTHLTITLPLLSEPEQLVSLNLHAKRLLTQKKSRFAGTNPTLMVITDTLYSGTTLRTLLKHVSTTLTFMDKLTPSLKRLVTLTELMLTPPSTSSRSSLRTIATQSPLMSVKSATQQNLISQSAQLKLLIATWKSPGTPLMETDLPSPNTLSKSKTNLDSTEKLPHA